MFSVQKTLCPCFTLREILWEKNEPYIVLMQNLYHKVSGILCHEILNFDKCKPYCILSFKQVINAKSSGSN